MPIVLIRVDERLIHGQVVVGWGRLEAERVVVVDDEIARSEWEQELYCLGLAPEVAVDFVTVEEARRRFADWQANEARTLVLMRNVETLRGLADGSLLEGTEVNLGGIHHAPGRRAHLPYLFLSAAEGQQLREIAAGGVRIVARDLPSSRAFGLDELLKGQDMAG